MTVRILYPNGETLESPSYPHFNLLAHAQLEEKGLGSECGGHGKCGKDRLRICQGRELLSPLTESEMRLLSLSEREQGIRLGCQAFPDSQEGLIEAEAIARSLASK